MKNSKCSMTNSVRFVRSILSESGAGRLAAIQYLRSLGMSFPTAKTMVEEIAADAKWYRCY